jgi:hypothetical protein
MTGTGRYRSGAVPVPVTGAGFRKRKDRQKRPAMQSCGFGSTVFEVSDFKKSHPYKNLLITLYRITSLTRKKNIFVENLFIVVNIFVDPIRNKIFWIHYSASMSSTPNVKNTIRVTGTSVQYGIRIKKPTVPNYCC